MTLAIVDSHHHLWASPTLEQYPWMAGDYAPLRRSYTIEDLGPVLLECDVEATIAVQSRSSIDESRWLLEVASKTRFIVGVVGWVDLAADNVRDQLRMLQASAGGDLLLGIRHQVHDEPDRNWLLRADVRRGLWAVAEAGLVYDLLVREPQLPAALATATAIPGLRFVIDHLAKPQIGAARRDPAWEAAMAPFSDLANVACKLSGMVTEADWAAWQPDDLAPYVENAVRWFGPDRLLFGSDWPVCLLAADYRRVLQTAQHLTAALPQQAQRDILGANALEHYSVERIPRKSR